MDQQGRDALARRGHRRCPLNRHVNRIPILRQQCAEKLNRAFIGVTKNPHRVAGRGELSPRLSLDRIAVFRPERIPQAALLVVRPHFRNLYRDQACRGNPDRDLLRCVVDFYIGTVSEIDTSEEFPGDDHQRPLGRAVPGIFVDNDIANHRLARYEFCDGTHLLDDDFVRDVGFVPEHSARKQAASAIPDRHDAEECGDDDRAPGPDDRAAGGRLSVADFARDG